MMKRNSDGTWRNARKPATASDAVQRARWVEAETLRLKQVGFSFDTIAEQITNVGRGLAASLVPIPNGVSFPPEYCITKQACHKALKRALAREPAAAVDQLRKLDNLRTEEMLIGLQPGIRKGNPRSVEVGVKVLSHMAKINGYAAPQLHELTGKDGAPLTLVQLLEAVGPISEDDNGNDK